MVWVDSSKPGAGRSQKSDAPEIYISVCLDCGTPIPARLIELARMDLMMLTDRPLRFGTQLQIAMYSDLISAVTQNRATVHWCHPQQSGWQVGAFLSQPLPDRLTENTWHDLRNNLRYDANWRAFVLFDGCGSLERVRILNYSINGLRLSVPGRRNLTGGFSLFTSSAGREGALLNGQVQWCREVDGSTQIGCMIHGQRGRDLPKMFGRLDAIHVADSGDQTNASGESIETLRCEMSLQERFLSAKDAAKVTRRLDDSDWYDLSNVT